MNDTTGLDPRAVRLQARRRARGAAPHFLQQTVERGLIERLEPVRLAPHRVVLTSGAMVSGMLPLRQRFPEAELLAFDDDARALAARRERLAPARSGLLARLRAVRERPLARFVAAHPLQLPIEPSSADLLISSLALHSCAQVDAQLAEWRRVLKPGGLFAFACFGVDSLIELRQLGARMQAFPDMHDLGDALVHQGFAEPVVDTERFAVTWRDPATLLDEVRQWGGNALAGRFQGLLTPRHRLDWIAAIETLRGVDGLIRLSVELIYGHAWCPAERRLPDGVSPVRIVRRSAGG